MKELNELVGLAKLANIAGQGTPEMADFRVTANPDNILAIAEAFRALEQRAEAAEAKLAERNKQRNPDYFLNRIESSDKWGPEVELRIYESQLDASKSQDDHGGGIIELFTRPAPAAGLAELVPHKTCDACIHVLAVLGFNYKTARIKDVLSEVKRLRNIEEAK